MNNNNMIIHTDSTGNIMKNQIQDTRIASWIDNASIYDGTKTEPSRIFEVRHEDIDGDESIVNTVDSVFFGYISELNLELSNNVETVVEWKKITLSIIEDHVISSAEYNNIDLRDYNVLFIYGRYDLMESFMPNHESAVIMTMDFTWVMLPETECEIKNIPEGELFVFPLPGFNENFEDNWIIRLL